MIVLIQNGTIVNAQGSTYTDLLIKNEQVYKVGKNLESEEKINTIIDASGCYIFPGGVDPHVHLHLKTAAGYTSDDFKSGTMAALYGGTTTIMDFVTPVRGQSLIDAFNLRKHEAQHSLINYKLHVSPVEWVKTTREEIQHCFVNEGVRSFKVYLAYKETLGINEGTLFQVMKTVGSLGGIVMVHCEMGSEIDVLRNKYATTGKTEVKYHALSRPDELESRAVAIAIDIAAKTNCPLYIVHVSAKSSIELIQKAQANLQTVYAETCPHYLLLNHKKYLADFESSAPYVLSPPLRKGKDIKALWNALADGSIRTIGTDHCSFSIEQKRLGKEDFRKIPNGAGSIEHRLELLYTYGYLKKKISINRMVDLFSTQAAKIFGLFPKKGIIAKGSDADLVIWDPKPERQITGVSHHQACDSNIYEGFKVRGMVKHIFVKGKHVIENGKMIDHPKGFYIL